jgi:hypothetical protein
MLKTKKAYNQSSIMIAEVDHEIILAMQTIASALHKKARAILESGDASADDIHYLISQSRSYSSRAHSYEKKARAQCERVAA